MLKKAKLSIIISAWILSSSLSFTGNDIQVPQDIRDKYEQHKTIIETPDKLHNSEKNLYINKDNTYKNR